MGSRALPAVLTPGHAHDTAETRGGQSAGFTWPPLASFPGLEKQRKTYWLKAEGRRDGEMGEKV